MKTLNRYIALCKFGLCSSQGQWYKCEEVDTLIIIQNGKLSALQADIKAKDARINVLERQIVNLNRICDKQSKDLLGFKSKYNKLSYVILGLLLACIVPTTWIVINLS